jgi:iron complex outermembrane recepter protein
MRGFALRRELVPAVLVAAALLARGAAMAQDASGAAAQQTLPPVEVIGTSPMLGSGIDRDKVPANTHSFSATDLSRDGMPSLSGTLNRDLPSINITDVQDSPFQPDIQFRGFDASPVAGTPQGLAIYQNGVRINEAFGDTVNWDLVPEFAVNRANLMSANPVFGLNALGGALALEMKNGFNFQGGQAAVSAGSFGRKDGMTEYGVQVGNVAAYFGGRGLYDQGWRDNSPSTLRQLYADVGTERDKFSLHVSFAGGLNSITGVGPTPVELLAQSRNAIYTSPQTTKNDVGLLTVTGSYQLSDVTSLDGNVYYRHFDQRIVNGNTTDAQSCTAPAGSMCFGDGTTTLHDTNGNVIPDVLNGATAGEIDRTRTKADGVGGSLQVTETAPLFDRANHLVAGGSFDHGSVNYQATSELGTISPSLAVIGTGFIIDQPSGDLAPVNLDTTNDYYGLYATNTFDLTQRLSLTASGRYNLAVIKLMDRAGNGLSGDHRFNRFNPGGGVTYKLTPEITSYASYSEANRAPTPGELACADPNHPCIIDSFLVSDPELKQVVSHTYEVGLRGALPASADRGRITWNFGLFRTDNQDDIMSVPSSQANIGFFQNVGNTRRQGVETGVRYESSSWLLRLNYTFLDATFQSPITLSSPNNPQADANGKIHVRPGDHIPSLPEHRIKLGVDYSLTDAWRIGGDLIVTSGQYLRGDEANQDPRLPGYEIVNLRTSYMLGERAELFGLVQNALNQKYETFGTFFDPTAISSLGLSDHRSLSPGAPFAAFGGVRIFF